MAHSAALLIFGASLVAALAQGQQIASPFKPRLRVRSSQVESLAKRGQETSLHATASPDIIWVQCPSEAQAFGALCGKLPQPLDRRHPNGPKIGIYFELYLHTNSGPLESAILFTTGGPGVTTTQSFIRAEALTLFSQNLDVHDVLLIDDRGRGLSAAINCEELQHGTAPFSSRMRWQSSTGAHPDAFSSDGSPFYFIQQGSEQ